MCVCVDEKKTNKQTKCWTAYGEKSTLNENAELMIKIIKQRLLNGSFKNGLSNRYHRGNVYRYDEDVHSFAAILFIVIAVIVATMKSVPDLIKMRIIFQSFLVP